MGLLIQCDTCGAMTNEVRLEVEFDGCKCCSEPEVYVAGPGGWSVYASDEVECPACFEARWATKKAEDSRIREAHDKRIREVMARFVRNQTYYTSDETEALSIMERERSSDA